MKILQKHTRPLDTKETKILTKIRSALQKDLLRGFKWPQLSTAILLGFACLYLATWTRYEVVRFLLGILSVFCLAYLVILPYEYLKERRKAKETIRKATRLLRSGVVEVISVKAKQIAVAKEHEDEGDLYIIEMENNSVLYMWDQTHTLKKNFPCLEFEVYDQEFVELIGRQINSLSEKIKPVVIDAASKNRYFKKTGSPEHLSVDRKNFEKLIEKMSNA